MAYDAGLFALMRDDLAGEPVTEMKMFGGIAFLLGGHMVSGLHKGGAMFRVGAGGIDQALAIPGTAPMMMGERPMTGMIAADDELMADDDRRRALTRLALSVARALPPKVAKPKKPR
jgi:TfoX/Sxy family transcriptional regulator of competence genes